MLRTISRAAPLRTAVGRFVVNTVSTNADYLRLIKTDKSAVVGFFGEKTQLESSAQLENEFERLSNRFSDIDFIKVTLPDNLKLSMQHGLTVAPSFAIYRKGEEIKVDRNPSIASLTQMVENIENEQPQSIGAGIKNFFSSLFNRSSEDETEERRNEAADLGARRNWETSPMDAAYKKHPLRNPQDVAEETGAGLNKIGQELKQGFDRAMANISKDRSAEQREDEAQQMERERIRELKEQRRNLNEAQQLRQHGEQQIEFDRQQFRNQQNRSQQQQQQQTFAASSRQSNQQDGDSNIRQMGDDVLEKNLKEERKMPNRSSKIRQNKNLESANKQAFSEGTLNESTMEKAANFSEITEPLGASDKDRQVESQRKQFDTSSMESHSKKQQLKGSSTKSVDNTMKSSSGPKKSKADKKQFQTGDA